MLAITNICLASWKLSVINCRTRDSNVNILMGSAEPGELSHWKRLTADISNSRLLWT
jgi:hypothetical protein